MVANFWKQPFTKMELNTKAGTSSIGGPYHGPSGWMMEDAGSALGRARFAEGSGLRG